MRSEGASSALTEWLSQSSLPSGKPSVGLVIGTFVCSIYQTFYVTASLFNRAFQSGPVFVITSVWYGAALLVLATIGSAVLLIASSRIPLMVLMIECALYVCAAALAMNDFFLFPVVFALFSCVNRSLVWGALTGFATALAAMVAGSFMVAIPGGLFVELAGQVGTIVIVTPLAIATRSIRSWRQSASRVRDSQMQSQRLERERDEAISRARIAEELHDSVGHGLTTIVALAEGLTGTTGNAQFDEALSGINHVARECLENTRRAVRRLSAISRTSWESHGIEFHELADLPHQYRHWDDVTPVLDQLRSLGVTVIFTETGMRPEPPEHAHLCFTITRESITNAIRHTTHLTHVSVAVDHSNHNWGMTRITVRNDGVNPPPSSVQDSPHIQGNHTDGTGLRRLTQQVEETGGTLTFGPEGADGWVLVADVCAPVTQGSNTEGTRA